MKTRLTSYFPACLLGVSSDNHGINCETEHLGNPIERFALHGFFQDLYTRITTHLSQEVRTALDQLLLVTPGETQSRFEQLKAEPSAPGVKHLQEEITKLQTLRALDIPAEALAVVPCKVLQTLKHRASNEHAGEMQSPFPRPSPQGPPAALPSPSLRRLSSTSESRAAPGAKALRRGGGTALGAREEPWASRGRRRVALGVLEGVLPRCRRKMPFTIPIRPAPQRSRFRRLRVHVDQ